MDPKRGIWINQLGYTTRAPKICVVPDPPRPDFEVQTIDESVTWKTVYHGHFQKSGNLSIGDFSCLDTPADYRVVCGQTSNDYREANRGSGLASNYFVIRDDAYSTAARMFLSYYTWQRCGSDRGWAGRCHQDPVPLVGTGRHLDLRGGYHQSGDLRIWAEGISLSVYALLRFQERIIPRWDHGDIDDEIRWGCDYFLRLVGPEGYAYDSQFVPIGWGPRDYYVTPAPFAAQLNIAQLLARAARHFRDTDSAFAQRCLDTARTLWHTITTLPAFDQPYKPPVDNLPRGTQNETFHWQTYRTSATGFAGQAAAALELFLTTREEAFREAALAAGDQLLALQITDGPLAGAYRQDAVTPNLAFSDCSYNYNAHGLHVMLDLYQALHERRFLIAYQRSCDLILRQLDAMNYTGVPNLRGGTAQSLPRGVPFADTPFPAVLTSAGAAAAACAMARNLNEASETLGNFRYAIAAQRCLDWIFGVNPEEASYITGIGYRHKQHLVFGQFFPSTPQIPGGVVHVMGGEYDLPAVAMALWAVATVPGSRL